ncbi:hypothetical protein [Yoonia sp. BS5-3]|uniref:Uncharacterized protein n=1 Tax=Yoonia phaeophyticola TaxID=3137369 RepID=A0ABZ2V2G9_9RHOB
MHRLNSRFPTVLAASLMMANATTADQIADGTRHAYFAQYTVLGPQPGCEAAGMTAYQLDFAASDVPFAVEHRPTGQVQSYRQEDKNRVPQTAPNGTAQPIVEAIVVEPEERCFITERRGGEHFQQEIACSGDRQIVDPFALLEAQDLALSLSGQAMVCVSLTGSAVMGGSWTANLDSGFEQVSHSGASFASNLRSCDEEQDAQPSVRFNHVMRGILGNPTEWGGYRIREDEPTAAGFHLALDNVPLPTESSIASRFKVRANAYFFPTFEGDADCPGGICRVPTSEPWLRPRPHRLICD